MKTICFYFQIHQPFRLKRYRFFDIGSDHYYYDDFSNEDIIRRISDKSFLRANSMLLSMVKEYNGKFKVAFSISGIALEQLEIYVPEAIDGFRELAKTGHVEFLAETYAHSLSSLTDPEEFNNQVKAHSNKIELLFGQKPKVFRNTELIYSDDIGELVAQMGYKAMLTEGAKHVLGWKSPNYLYSSAVNPKLTLLLRNSKFSDDISFRFSNYDWSEYPLVADKFINWINALSEEEQLVNIFMNYETLGSLQPGETGIFEFFKALPRYAFEKNIGFSTPSEIVNKLKPVASVAVPYPCSWAGEEKDLSPWQGNVLQKEALQKLYEIGERVRLCEDRRILQDWVYLQTSDHFHFMSTKTFPGPSAFSPYENAYDAFNNYMNVLSDFKTRVEAQFPSNIDNEELNSLLTTIRNQGIEIEILKKKLALADSEVSGEDSLNKSKGKVTAKKKSVGLN
ncbi:MAG: glycoside hydrolase family 57 protein [Dysgonamonadaceae bacterium]|jgi:alpha-amylase|nr:glycoside hydrolase family 57 protein [Dysgonamonadaceae bacterium]